MNQPNDIELELLFRWTTGSASEAEDDRVETWRRSSPENEKSLQEFLNLHALIVRAGSGTDPGPAPRPARLREAAARRRREGGRFRERPRSRSIWKLAAGLGLAACLAALVGRGLFVGSAPGPESSAPHEFVAGADGPSTATLGDGTVVRLLEGSRLRVTMDGAERVAELDGRAFFAVAPDSQRPFRVETDAGTAEVLGTRFDVSTNEDGLRLIVVEGLVELTSGSTRVQVPAGSVSGVVDETILEVEELDNALDLVDWMDAFLAFQATPLEQVVRELEYHYDVRIRVEDPDLLARTVTTSISDASVSNAVEIICAIIRAQCSVEDDEVTIGTSEGTTTGGAELVGGPRAYNADREER